MARTRQRDNLPECDSKRQCVGNGVESLAPKVWNLFECSAERPLERLKLLEAKATELAETLTADSREVVALSDGDLRQCLRKYIAAKWNDAAQKPSDEREEGACPDWLWFMTLLWVRNYALRGIQVFLEEVENEDDDEDEDECAGGEDDDDDDDDDEDDDECAGGGDAADAGVQPVSPEDKKRYSGVLNALDGSVFESAENVLDETECPTVGAAAQYYLENGFELA